MIHVDGSEGLIAAVVAIAGSLVGYGDLKRASREQGKTLERHEDGLKEIVSIKTTLGRIEQHVNDMHSFVLGDKNGKVG